MMEPLPMFPKLTNQNKILGLEMIDLLFLIALFMVVFLMSSELIPNLAVMAAGYCSLRLYKRKKPPRYTQSLIRFLILPERYHVGSEVSE